MATRECEWCAARFVPYHNSRAHVCCSIQCQRKRQEYLRPRDRTKDKPRTPKPRHYEFCVVCGETLAGRSKKAKCCSSRCSCAWFARTNPGGAKAIKERTLAKLRAASKAKYGVRLCLRCGVAVQRQRPDAKFCSKRCWSAFAQKQFRDEHREKWREQQRRHNAIYRRTHLEQARSKEREYSRLWRTRHPSEREYSLARSEAKGLLRGAVPEPDLVEAIVVLKQFRRREKHV